MLGEVREGDVFRFSYSTECRAKIFEPNHCFDGQLVAVLYGGDLVLMDTYWLHGFEPRGDARWFSRSDVMAKGELKFICNLNDTVRIGESDTQYFDDADWFNLSYQHGCYTWFARRADAKRSSAKMLSVIRDKISAERRSIESATYNIERFARAEQQIESGQTEGVYL